MKRLVSVSKLECFRILLETEADRKKLLEYFDKYILNKKNISLNELKKTIYEEMKICTKTKKTDKANKLYDLYQDTKKDKIDINKCWKEFINIVVK
jgi:hypothetical protein